jgi:hypothetical protein
MPDVSRRQFLRHASIGAAAAGVLAATGTGIVSVLESTSNAPVALPAGADSAQGGTDVFARVIDAKSGHIKIYVGTKAVDFTSQAVAQQLLKAVQ